MRNGCFIEITVYDDTRTLIKSRRFSSLGAPVLRSIAMVTLFKGKVPASFTPTLWFTLTADQIPLTFLLTASGGPSEFDFYLEFTDDPTQTPVVASREVDEQDVGLGVVSMSKVIRTFRENGGGLLQNGQHNLSCQFLRIKPFARIQIQAPSGTIVATISTASGDLPVAP